MRRALVLLMTAAVTVATAGAAGASTAAKNKLPEDTCALVTEAQLAPLVPGATPEPADISKKEVRCVWTADDDTDFQVTILKSPTKKGLLTRAVKGEAQLDGGEPIEDLGDFAYQASTIPTSTKVKVLKGKLVITVKFSGEAPVTEDQIANTLAVAGSVVDQL